MAKTRQFLKQDLAVIGSGPAMMSASQQPIQLNDVLYETDLVDGRYSSKMELDEQKFSITAHRVIQVNYQYRNVRIRCANGCEVTLSFGGDKCPRTKYWHSVEDAKKELAVKLDGFVKIATGEISKQKARIDHYQELKKSLPAFNVIKTPVKVS
jgi:hypothetical protein